MFLYYISRFEPDGNYLLEYYDRILYLPMYSIYRVATMYYMYYRGKANVLYGTILEK